MADGELLELAAKPDDLTEMANEVLRGEMARRHLKAEEPVAEWGLKAARTVAEPAAARRFEGGVSPDPFGAVAIGSAWGAPEPSSARKGMASLMVFYDAIELGRACDFLEEQEIGFEINDLSKPRSGLTPFERPVEMELVVAQADKLRAMAVLREKMGLFPLQEVEVADAPEDGALMVVASFGRRSDADEVAQVLADAGVWRQVSENEDGAEETEDAFTVEVREVDQEKALGVVEKAMGIAEE